MKVRKINKVLISQPKPKSERSPYYDIGEKYNVDIHFYPFIRVDRVSLKEFRQQRINILDHTAIIFTARTAVDKFFSICEEMKITVPESMKYFAYRKRSLSTCRNISSIGNGRFSLVQRVELRAKQCFTKHSKEKFPLPVPEEHSDEVVNFWMKKDRYTKSVMYRTVSNDFPEDETLITI